MVVTAKYEPNAHRCLDHVGLEVDDVVGWRHGPGKAETLSEHGAAVYVGDTPPDMLRPRGRRARSRSGVTHRTPRPGGLPWTRVPTSCSARSTEFPEWFRGVVRGASWRARAGGGAAAPPAAVEHDHHREKQEPAGGHDVEHAVVVAHRRRHVDRCVDPAAGAMVTGFPPGSSTTTCSANDRCTSASSCWSIPATSTRCAVSACTSCWSDVDARSQVLQVDRPAHRVLRREQRRVARHREVAAAARRRR